MNRYYPAIIHKEKSTDYGVSFPDLPGCVTAGSTPEEAHLMAEEALQLHIDGMLEEGLPVPEPSSLNDAYRQAARAKARVVTLIPVKLPARAKRINITMDGNLLDEVDAKAASRGMTRSAFLAEGARRLMEE